MKSDRDFPGWLRPKEPLPPLPEQSVRLQRLLKRLRLKTLGQLYRLNTGATRSLQGVGAALEAELSDYRRRVLETARSESRGDLPDTQDASLPLEAPLPPPPTLIRMALDAAGVRTVGDLMALRDEQLRAIRGVGLKKRKRVARFREEVRDLYRTGHLPGEGSAEPQPEEPDTWRGVSDLRELCRALRDEMSGREEYIFFKRYLKEETLQATAATLQISCERLQQLQQETLKRLHRLAGTTASALLTSALGHPREPLPQELHPEQLRDTGLERGELRFLLDVATAHPWQRDGDRLRRTLGARTGPGGGEELV